MFARFAFFIAICLGLAVAPVRTSTSCATAGDAPSCQSCCAARETACCDTAGDSEGPALPAKIAPAAGDAKHLVSPTLILLGFAPSPAAEPPAVRRQHAARIPVLPLIEKTCIRLL